MLSWSGVLSLSIFFLKGLMAASAHKSMIVEVHSHSLTICYFVWITFRSFPLGFKFFLDCAKELSDAFS